MRAYVVTTGVLFRLLTVAHVLRIFGEEAHLARDPFYVGITILTAVLCAWSWHVLRRAKAVAADQ